ncbi:sigma-70 family RNA polymerase sigma factor [Catenulispora sp. NF23]|uniref:RNA polymerase sigma factor n=1 Tax=Catenulispora pinistramenti TaxID=2705254 RepID=A0ABS5L5M8_9ACTN|nr:sigma-70 family RNA polymerase sigma factor [Catenulispora pinistramenti]MBS2539005.1 sigma-70 family RNA polymerase sigma factor [Catenulispora pinistramenti]MBS2553651.1 sigma-70 family RNA polymerase sigma factor [Catenulispora pinistramenti]
MPDSGVAENEAEVRVGAEAAIGALYRQHRTPLLQYVRQLIPYDPHRAEDVVQETFLRAWFLVRTGADRPGSLRPWLFTVARNLVIDMSRRDRARPLEVNDEATVANVPDLRDLADSVSQTRLVVDALAALHPYQREVLIHVHCLGRTRTETARVLGIPAGTVKSRNHHAVRALRRVLTDCGAA